MPKTEHWVIIHGTFARSSSFIKWWKKGGDAHEALSKALSHKKTALLFILLDGQDTTIIKLEKMPLAS